MRRCPWAVVRPYHVFSSTRADATSATAPTSGPSCGRARCRLPRAGQARAGRAIISATDGRPRKGRPWGGVRAEAAAGGSPSESASYVGSRVCGAGFVTGVSAGREGNALLIASSARLRWPGSTGSGAVWIPSLRVALGPRAVQVWRPSGRATQDARGWRVLASRPVAVTLAAGGGSNGRKPSPTAARLGRCGPRDRPAGDRRPGARRDRGLGVGSSTGSLRSR